MDVLFLVKPGFTDPAYPGVQFYCWHCALLEGVLATFPECAAKLDVRRVDWPRPRHEVIELAGEANQSLPLLVLADQTGSDGPPDGRTGRRLIADKDAILATLSERHGFPCPHP